MADNKGIFEDLFSAVGEPVQNVADSATEAIGIAGNLVQECIGVCGKLATTTVTTGLQLAQDVISGITSNLGQKQQ